MPLPPTRVERMALCGVRGTTADAARQHDETIYQNAFVLGIAEATGDYIACVVRLAQINKAAMEKFESGSAEHTYIAGQNALLKTLGSELVAILDKARERHEKS